MEILYKRTSLGKVQQWQAITALDTIVIEFGQLNGKIQRNEIQCIGKQKRSDFQQAEFELKALYKSKRDEGYKSLEDLGYIQYVGEDTVADIEDVLQRLLPEHNTNKEGHLKVMLSQPISRTVKGKVTDIWDKVKYPIAGEYKLDGVRCVIKARPTPNSNSTLSELFSTPVMSLSRDSMDYDFGTRKVREKLEPLFEKYPNIVLDGELYKHDIPQNHTSGAMRSKSGGEYKYVWDIMEYHVWDIIDTTLTYNERRTILKDLRAEFPDAFVLNRAKILYNKEQLDAFEEFAVEAGYEGIMLKTLDGLYKPDKRSFDSIKVKRFYDAEFRVIGYELGSRGIQDLVLNCTTNEGIDFKATAMGTIKDKELLSNEIDKRIDNQLIYGTVKYKFISENGKPSHAQFKGLK